MEQNEKKQYVNPIIREIELGNSVINAADLPGGSPNNEEGD